MTIEEYFSDWLKYIDVNELYRIITILRKEYSTKTVFPLYKDIFKAFHLCSYKNLKAVFIGQDVYPDKYNNLPRATGLAFANRNEVSDDNISPSLKILKESIINFEMPHNHIIFANDLEEWANQGILLLNSALTVEEGKIGSHIMLWRPFISSFLKKLSNDTCSMLYVLFGSQAQTFKPCINELTSITCEFKHPAYYARTHTKMPYKTFHIINNRIKRLTGETINWYKEL